MPTMSSTTIDVVNSFLVHVPELRVLACTKCRQGLPSIKRVYNHILTRHCKGKTDDLAELRSCRSQLDGLDVIDADSVGPAHRTYRFDFLGEPVQCQQCVRCSAIMASYKSAKNHLNTEHGITADDN